MSVHAMVNREVRVIPKGWQHPDYLDHPRKRPLLSADEWPATPEALAEWLAEDENGERPDRDDFMPSVHGLAPEETEIMAYETTSEGSPISPAFPNSPEGILKPWKAGG